MFLEHNEFIDFWNYTGNLKPYNGWTSSLASYLNFEFFIKLLNFRLVQIESICRLLFRFNPFPNKLWFLRVCRSSLLKTLWDMEKLTGWKTFCHFPNKPWFLCVYSTSLLKTLWEKEKLIVMSNFSFSYSVFYLFVELSTIFNIPEIVRLQTLSVMKSPTFVVWERVKSNDWICVVERIRNISWKGTRYWILFFQNIFKRPISRVCQNTV